MINNREVVFDNNGMGYRKCGRPSKSTQLTPLTCVIVDGDPHGEIRMVGGAFFTADKKQIYAYRVLPDIVLPKTTNAFGSKKPIKLSKIPITRLTVLKSLPHFFWSIDVELVRPFIDEAVKLISSSRPYRDGEKPSLGDEIITNNGDQTKIIGYINGETIITPVGRFDKSEVRIVEQD